MTPPLALTLYRAATLAATPFAGALLSLRLNRGKEDPDRVDERRGLPGLARPEGPLVWLHGASVGETLSLLPLIERLTQGGLNALVTSGTLTSARLMASRLPPRAQHQFAPLDAPPFFRRFFAHWRPDLGLIAESEIWPNMICEAARAAAPLAMVNARMSERSFRRWERSPGLARALIGRFDVLLAQSAADAERFLRLGARAAPVIGNMKFDAPPPPADHRELAELSGLVAGRRLWIAASTHAGEERAAAEAHLKLKTAYPDLLTLIAPRHPERGPEIAAELAEIGLVCRLRSRGERPERDGEIYICDTIGELGLFYRLAGVVFVGRSLFSGGGQNPIEPAKLASAILHGPHVGNFADVYAPLDAEGGAMTARDADELAAALAGLFSDAARLRAMARVAAEVVGRRGGAVERALAALSTHLTALAPCK
ncbi:MAG TPA: 3-deoxy-D-manno-octulosonic acid transferase [Roseiarcus sp.]|nr:3-deoxy-D-manno-octulosonic acid transferase [Roseiarcus sp.]